LFNATEWLTLGNDPGTDSPHAILDEVRIATVPRNECWLQTELNNQSSPSTFLAIGAEEVN